MDKQGGAADERLSLMNGRDLRAQCVELLLGLGLRSLAAKVRVVWNARLRSTAGRAWIRESRIELNPRLAEFGMDQVRVTLLHELAHLVAHERHSG
ncbi:MAG: SprT-like domain-containing protein, partial [Verrucomicrobiales bacterium]